MHQVVLFVFDAGRHGPDSVSSLAAGAMVIRGDLVTGAGLDEIPAEVDTVIHLATNPDTGRRIKRSTISVPRTVERARWSTGSDGLHQFGCGLGASSR
jgi:nucleoside-diphosphate-sugar epimerase